jgi:hypothetical protein
MKTAPQLRGTGLRMLAAFLACALTCAGTLAQSGTSSIRGTVFDTQGNAVAGVTVTLSNPEKSVTRTQSTNESGGYSFTGLPPGQYRVEAESTGFKKVVAERVTASVDTPAEFDIHLEVGSVAEAVTVSSALEAPLNTSDAKLGTTFERRRVEQLPLNARNIVGLLSLQPGVTADGYVNGGRADQSNITLDGVDVNEQQSGLDIVTGEAFASVLRVTPDSVDEFRVTTTNPNADQGRSSGAQVSLVTRSGGNELHGSLYHYHRNTVTTANDFFNNKAGVPRPQLLRNIFGGSVAGPIRKDRAFFFFTYEGFREATATSRVKLVPLPHLAQGVIRYETESPTAGEPCPSSSNAARRCVTLTPAAIEAAYLAANGVSPGVNPLAVSYLGDIARRYPANDTTVGDGLNTGGFRFNARTPTSLDTYIGKLDFNLTDRQTLFVRGNYQNDLVTLPRDLPDSAAPAIWRHPKGLSLGHTWVASQSLVNNLRYGLTRAAFSQLGESDQPAVGFRFIFVPGVIPGGGLLRTLTRVTPVHNFVEDLSWTRGTHTLQLGGNVRLVRNTSSSFATAYDTVTTNPSGYAASSAVLTRADGGRGALIFPGLAPGAESPLRNALSAYIGRFSGYFANFKYDAEGNLLPAGSPSDRTFATEEYELYAQDSWRIRQNLTLNYGLRWSTSTPVYETNGLQVQPVQSLGEFFERRVAGMESGVPYNELITLDRSGKANGRPGFYAQDWNNFAPSVSLAWTPDFGDNFFGRLVGRGGRSVVRGGFRMSYDRIGSQLAVTFDLGNVLGFSSTGQVSPGFYNVTTRLPPLFTGPNPDVRTFPLIAGSFSDRLQFPLSHPADDGERIEFSLDDTITTPRNYSFNLSYGRELWKGLSFEAAYVGRVAHDLLAQRDVMHFNNIRDPQSGMSWYEAMRILIGHRYAQTPIDRVGTIPFFENVLPGLASNLELGGFSNTQAMYLFIAPASVGGFDITDYTVLQSNLLFNSRPFAARDNTFVHPQYATLMAWSTVGRSNYHSGQFSIRQRLRDDVAFDFNYTLSHSHDNASGLQSSGAGSVAALIFDPTNLDSNYAESDFDVRHIVNANWLVGLPVGRGKAFLNDLPGAAEAVLGGWQLTGIFRWNSGYPLVGFRPFAFQRWATNWQISSGMVARRPIGVCHGDVGGEPNLFCDPQEAYLSYRDPFPGEPGDRNQLRFPGYVALDAALHKTFQLPWSENQRVIFRWEVFNVTNTQRLTGLAGGNLAADPFLNGGNAPETFGRFTATQTPLNETKAGRVMQFALRFQF